MTAEYACLEADKIDDKARAVGGRLLFLRADNAECV